LVLFGCSTPTWLRVGEQMWNDGQQGSAVMDIPFTGRCDMLTKIPPMTMMQTQGVPLQESRVAIGLANQCTIIYIIVPQK